MGYRIFHKFNKLRLECVLPQNNKNKRLITSDFGNKQEIFHTQFHVVHQAKTAEKPVIWRFPRIHPNSLKNPPSGKRHFLNPR